MVSEKAEGKKITKKEGSSPVAGTSDGNEYDYGFRIYNPRIGKFLSVDPLFKSYPGLTPYQFASNRPIWGVDLDGLEFVHSSEARIKIVNGKAHLNLENCYRSTRGAWRTRDECINQGLQPQPEGYIGGWPTSVGLFNFEVIKAPEPVSLDPDVKPDVNKELGLVYNLIPYESPKRKDNEPDMRFKGNKINATQGGQKTSEGTGRVPFIGKVTVGRLSGAALAVNAISEGLYQLTVWDAYYDWKAATEQKSILFNEVMAAINIAIDRNMIKQEYQNSTDLANIASVVYCGVNPTANQEIYDIGIQIVKQITKNYQYGTEVLSTTGATNSNNPCDALKVNKTIVVPPIVPPTQ